MQLGYGESLKLVGASPEFGSWNLDVAPEMTWNEGDVWTGKQIAYSIYGLHARSLDAQVYPSLQIFSIRSDRRSCCKTN